MDKQVVSQIDPNVPPTLYMGAEENQIPCGYFLKGYSLG
jgi:hypothetical protein